MIWKRRLIHCFLKTGRFDEEFGVIVKLEFCSLKAFPSKTYGPQFKLFMSQFHTKQSCHVGNNCVYACSWTKGKGKNDG